MRKGYRYGLLALFFGAAALNPVLAGQLENARESLANHLAQHITWDGPTAGPRAIPNRRIVVLAADMKNGGVAGVSDGIKEAAQAIGWQVTLIDGQGTQSGRAAAFSQGLAMAPDGIVIDGFDALEQKEAVNTAAGRGIAMVSWHAASGVGRIPDTPVFANITANTRHVAKAAADWAFVDAGGSAHGLPGVVILTDNNFAVAIAKSRRMAEIIRSYGGTILAVENVPIAESASRVPPLTTSLWKQFGHRWTHTLAINDIYFDHMGPAFAAVGIPPDTAPKAIAAGDGSSSAYQRIRAGQYQAVTVSEPLNLQGWQLVDELNRAFAGERWSGYETPFKVITEQNVMFEGGKQNRFDPDNHYRDHYLKLWRP